MAKKQAQEGSTSVTTERSRRLFQLLKLLAQGPQSRATLTRRLRLGIRGFYRDLEVLRAVGIDVLLDNSKYALAVDIAEVVERLPFPDPQLNLGEARLLAKGRSKAHKKLRSLLDQIEK